MDWHLIYLKRIEEEKKQFEVVPCIHTGKTPSENFNCRLLPTLSEAAKEHGFKIKLINMVGSLDSTNMHIIELYHIWNLISSNDVRCQVFNTYYIQRQNQITAYIIYDLRRFADQMIAIVFCLLQKDEIGSFEIDCIGVYLKKREKNPELSIFDKHIGFLQLLNDISNVYKHSISNDMRILLGRDEPCIYAFDGQRNKNVYSPAVQGIAIRELIGQFNDFYKESFRIIEALS